MRLNIEKIIRLEIVGTAYIIRHGETNEIIGLMNDVELSRFIKEAQRVKNLPVSK